MNKSVPPVDELQSWMEATYSDKSLTHALIEYIQSRGKRQMNGICQNAPYLNEFAKEIDQLWWDNMVDGGIAKKLFSLQHDHLSKKAPHVNIRTWAQNVVKKPADHTPTMAVLKCIHTH